MLFFRSIRCCLGEMSSPFIFTSKQHKFCDKSNPTLHIGFTPFSQFEILICSSYFLLWPSFFLEERRCKKQAKCAYLNIWCQDWFHLNSLPPTIPHTQCPQLNITVMQSKLLINYQSIMSSIQCLDLRSIFCRCFHIITQFLGFLTDSNSTRYTFVLLPIFHQHDIPCYYLTLKWIRRIAHLAISSTF